MSGITFQEEPLRDCLDEASDLLQQHWEEICADKAALKLNPDYDFYRRLDDTGVGSCTTARRDGRLVGYLLFLIAHNPHYRDVLMASEDLHFLQKVERRGRAGFDLIKNAEAAATQRGATYITLRVKAWDTLQVKMLERLGYTVTDIVLTKSVG